ncbi:hypothetical protein AWC05_14200 [Mycobacterium florentinum]|uniref:DUF3060 domain-containing protein n=1 Tax=Mycobacterium florentinum TaxID=292462 RepID=A0A1X1UDW3_MYCFL|nr:DUF3060 domain-containing protein [Mycobacterium florentinum]MCV7411999.1 DUF3060 domain-containing protein [Mycobacterium florentinum]ORV55015.1 hypothetical protein AWC05_14200 [Mycobacterium florentinum]BBX81365.1 membrane protein [Mycobacterium florentinum]
MDPEKQDPEDYIRELERGVGQPPGAAPRPSGTSKSGRGGGGTPGATWWHRFGDVAKLANTPRGWGILMGGCLAAFAIAAFVGHYTGTTVHGNLTMINGGAKDKIDCNDGNLRLEGDNNTYTVTGHCRRLDVSGSANHVTVDSADTISVFGDDNAMIYHSGSPTINKTGNNNIVSQRQKAPDDR